MEFQQLPSACSGSNVPRWHHILVYSCPSEQASEYILLPSDASDPMHRHIGQLHLGFKDPPPLLGILLDLRRRRSLVLLRVRNETFEAQ